MNVLSTFGYIFWHKAMWTQEAYTAINAYSREIKFESPGILQRPFRFLSFLANVSIVRTIDVQMRCDTRSAKCSLRGSSWRVSDTASV